MSNEANFNGWSEESLLLASLLLVLLKNLVKWDSFPNPPKKNPPRTMEICANLCQTHAKSMKMM